MVDRRSLRYAGRREELRDQAATWVLQRGLAGLSLRALAADLGISHRTLLHHFPTKEELIAEVLRELRGRSVKVLGELADGATATDHRTLILEMWEHFTAPQNLPYHRLFFEVYGLALADVDRYRPYFDGFVTDWGDAVTQLLAAADISAAERATLATLIVATFRGLLLDVLVTGEEHRARLAIERFAQEVN